MNIIILLYATISAILANPILLKGFTKCIYLFIENIYTSYNDLNIIPRPKIIALLPINKNLRYLLLLGNPIIPLLHIKL